MFRKITFVFMVLVAATLLACSNEPKQPQYEQPVQGITVKKSDGAPTQTDSTVVQPDK